MNLNATTLTVRLNNLTSGQAYSARVVAYSRAGMGPFSAPALLHMDPSSLLLSDSNLNQAPGDGPVNPFFQDNWHVFFGVLVALVLVVVGAILYYVRRHNSNKKQLGHHSGECE